jgi:hypothetical protein
MMSEHQHGAAPHATAAAPTLSLLRLSAGQRLAGAAVVLACLWLMVLLTI